MVVQYFLARRYPRSILRYVFFPAIFGAAGQIPPATCWYLGQWVIVGLIFNYFIRRRFFGWWSTYLPLLISSPEKTSKTLANLPSLTQVVITMSCLVRWILAQHSVSSLSHLVLVLVARVSQIGGAIPFHSTTWMRTALL